MKIVGERVAVQAFKMARLAKRDGAELPVHRQVERVIAAEGAALEAPAREVVGDTFEQRLRIDRALRIRMHPDESESLDRRQLDQAEASAIDCADVLLHRYTRQRTGRIVRSGVELARETRLLTTRRMFDDRSGGDRNSETRAHDRWRRA